MSRLDFMNCPLCAGHEKIGADAVHSLREAIELYLVPATDLPEYVRGELQNIANAIRNSPEPDRVSIVPVPALVEAELVYQAKLNGIPLQEDSWLDA